MTTFKTYFAWWGKASTCLPPSRQQFPGWHPLPFHALDVAAVAYEYLARSRSLQALFKDCLPGLGQEALCRWFAFWLALHDLGKFAQAFQSQQQDLFRWLQGREVRCSYTVRHDTLGWLYWQEVLSGQLLDEAWLGDDAEDLLDGLNWWMRAVTGHHGQPPEACSGSWRQHFSVQEDKAAIDDFVTDLRSLFFTDTIRSLSKSLDAVAFLQRSQTLSWWIAGLTVLADWLGSNSRYFPFHAEPLSLAEYWARARGQACLALKESGLTDVARQKPRRFGELYPHILQPSPLQRWAESTPLVPAPQLHLLEDVTGAGKTEAAVTLTHRLMAADLADGFFIALPTMATANAMYGRMATMYQLLFGDLAHLVLAHGQRKLVDRFAASLIHPGQREADLPQDETATAHCAAWLADRNKSALLAQAGVGTIDQVLLAVLHGKHQSLRLLGLFRKVLVVDEVHACDPYMQALLENLLEFHAQVGGSAILLSATLPVAMKQSLLAAFARGRAAVCAPLCVQDYPLVTSWPGKTPAQALEQPIATRPDVGRIVQTHYVSDEAVVIAHLREVLAQGACACWMRNTVADALAAYHALAAFVPAQQLILFHARFCHADRLHTEQRILACFGKDSTPEERTGKLVIATQVAEQSLDADWDFVVSDLAPMDRLIQRAGRLRRHPRDAAGRRLADGLAQDQRGPACLWVFGPLWTAAPAANWFKAQFPKAAGVYPHHGQLWRTARGLQHGQIAMPQDARSLIEDVFSPDAVFPEALQSIAATVEGAHYGEKSLAQQHSVKLAVGYVRDGLDWWSEAASPSRLGEPTTTVVLACWQDGRLQPWASAAGSQAWAYSSLRVAQRQIAATASGQTPERQREIDRILGALPGRGKWSVLLPLEKTDGHWQGHALAAPQGDSPPRETCWRYSDQFGLMALEEGAGSAIPP